MLAFPGVQALDVVGPTEVFSLADRIAGGYRTEVVTMDGALLETTTTPVEEVALRCGFGTLETLRRAFARRVGVSPSDYRGRFGALATEAA